MSAMIFKNRFFVFALFSGEQALTISSDVNHSSRSPNRQIQSQLKMKVQSGIYTSSALGQLKPPDKQQQVEHLEAKFSHTQRSIMMLINLH